MNSVTTTGQSRLRQELKPYVTQTSLEQQFSDFAQDIETGTFQLPSFNSYASAKPATGDVTLSDQRIINLATVPGASIDEILQSGSSAVNVNTMSNYTTLQLLLNTAYCGPLSSNMDVKNKKITNMASAETIIQNDPQRVNKLKQGVNQQFLLDNSVSLGLRKANDGTDDVIQLAGAFSAFKPNATFQTVEPTIIQGVADPVRDFDAVNKRSTVAQDPNEVLDPVFNQPYNRLLAGDRVLQVRDTIDPVVPTVPGTQWHTMVNNQAITKSYGDGKYHQKNKNIDFGNNKGINCSDPTSDQDVATKAYCDNNSKNDDGTGAVVGGILGTLGGAVSGSLATALFSTLGSGLSAMGGITGSLGAGTGLFATGLQVGSSLDFDAVKPQGSSEGALINNIKDDIANGGQGLDNSQAQGGGQFSGPLQVSGLFSAVRNAQVALFQLA